MPDEKPRPISTLTGSFSASEDAAGSETGPLAQASPTARTLPSAPDSTEAGLALPGRGGDRFSNLVELARGGFGRVSTAYDHSLERTVALKELLETTPERRRRFRREAVLTARMQHPGVVPIHEAGTWQSGEQYYVMPVLDGRTLKDLLADAKILAERLELLPILIELTETVAYAHSRRIIHRDLKPSNVLVGSSGHPVIIDWGLAKDLELDEGLEPLPVGAMRLNFGQGAELTVAGAVVGTPAYMSPEQARGEDVDERCDVYAIGAILYELLCGRPPHVGPSVLEVLELARKNDFADARQREPEAPDTLCTIARQALDSDPERRQLSAEELAGQLRAFLDPHNIANEHLRGIWDAPRRDALRAAILASRRAYAGDTWVRLAQVLDRYASEWRVMYRTVWEATHVLREQSEQTLEARMSYLHRCLSECAALVDLLCAEPDERAVDHAVEAALNLRSIAACQRADRRVDTIPLPVDPELRSEIESIAKKLDGVEALQRIEHYKEGVALAETLLDPAARTGYLPLEARALYLLGSLSMVHHPARAEALLSKAILACAQALDATLVARAWGFLIATVGGGLGKHADALQFRLAAESAAALASDSLSTAWLCNNLGGVLQMQGECELAAEQFQRSLELKTAALGEDHPDVARTLSNLSSVYVRQQRYEEAEHTLQRAVLLTEDALGLESPGLIAPLVNLAHVLNARSHPDKALTVSRRALLIHEHAGRPILPDRAEILACLGEALLGVEQTDEALETLQHALDEYETINNSWVTEGRICFALARTLAALGSEPLKMREFAMRARDVYSGAGSTAVAEETTVERWLDAHRA